MGVNKYRLEKEEQVDVLSIDNSKTIKSQIAKLEQLFATRDQEKVESLYKTYSIIDNDQAERALAALKSCAETGDGNLLELAMQVRGNQYSVLYLKFILFVVPMAGQS